MVDWQVSEGNVKQDLKLLLLLGGYCASKVSVFPCLLSLLTSPQITSDPIFISLFSCRLLVFMTGWSKQCPSHLYWVLTFSSPGWDKGNTVLLPFPVICVSLCPHQVSLEGSCCAFYFLYNSQVSCVRICAECTFNNCSWLIYSLFSIAGTQCHTVFKEPTEHRGKCFRRSSFEAGSSTLRELQQREISKSI